MLINAGRKLVLFIDFEIVYFFFQKLELIGHFY